MLNCDCYIAIVETILLYTEKSSGSFKNVIYKKCLQIIHIYMCVCVCVCVCVSVRVCVCV